MPGTGAGRQLDPDPLLAHIKDLLENIKGQADNTASEGGGSGSGDPNDLLSSLLSALAGGSEEGTGKRLLWTAVRAIGSHIGYRFPACRNCGFGRGQCGRRE